MNIDQITDRSKLMSIPMLIEMLGITDVNYIDEYTSTQNGYTFKDYINHGFSEREALENLYVSKMMYL